MKKAKFLLATAAVATAITCAVGCTACGGGSSADKDKDIAAVYQQYVAYADAKGETALTYEQWLETIKGAQGATGKSAYEVAVANGFEGTEAEWLASLKGEDGKKGDKGDKGSRGDSGENGADGVGVEGIYVTSEGTLVKFTDGTIKPINNGGVKNTLLKLGDNQIELPVAASSKSPSETEFSFYLLTTGEYEFRICSDLVVKYTGYNLIEENGHISESGGTYDPYKKTPAGQWEDGTDYYAHKFDVLAGYVNEFTIKNYSTTKTSFKFEIVKVEDEQ